MNLQENQNSIIKKGKDQQSKNCKERREWKNQYIGETTHKMQYVY